MKCWTEIGNNLRPHHCATFFDTSKTLCLSSIFKSFSSWGNIARSFLLFSFMVFLNQSVHVFRFIPHWLQHLMRLGRYSHQHHAFSVIGAPPCSRTAAAMCVLCFHYLASSLSSSSCSASRGITLLMSWSSKYLFSLADSSTLATV